MIAKIYTSLILIVLAFPSFANEDNNTLEEGKMEAVALLAWGNLISPEKCRRIFDKKEVGSAVLPLYIDGKFYEEKDNFIKECNSFQKTAKKINRKYGYPIGTLFYKRDINIDVEKIKNTPIAQHFNDNSYKMRVVHLLFKPLDSDTTLKEKGISLFFKCSKESCEQGQIIGLDDKIKFSKKKDD